MGITWLAGSSGSTEGRDKWNKRAEQDLGENSYFAL